MSQQCVSKLELLSYFTGDLNESRCRDIVLHIERCRECSSSLEALSQKQLRFLEKYPNPQIDQKKTVPPGVFKPLLSIAASLIMVVTAVLYLQINKNVPERIKGTEKIEMFVLGDNNVVEKRSSKQYYPGERIQFSYSSAGEKYFMLMSMDATGKTFVYFPAGDSAAMMLKNGAGVPLSSSIQLDNYIGMEVYIAVFSEKRFMVNDIVNRMKSAFKRTGSLDHMNNVLYGYHIECFLIEKRQRP